MKKALLALVVFGALLVTVGPAKAGGVVIGIGPAYPPYPAYVAPPPVVVRPAPVVVAPRPYYYGRPYGSYYYGYGPRYYRHW